MPGWSRPTGQTAKAVSSGGRARSPVGGSIAVISSNAVGEDRNFVLRELRCGNVCFAQRNSFHRRRGLFQARWTSTASGVYIGSREDWRTQESQVLVYPIRLA